MVGIISLAVMTALGTASAHEFDSKINYDVDNVTLDGLSETSK